MHPDEKRRRDDDVTAGAAHASQILGHAEGIDDVFEDLLADHDVERSPLQRGIGDIELG